MFSVRLSRNALLLVLAALAVLAVLLLSSVEIAGAAQGKNPKKGGAKKGADKSETLLEREDQLKADDPVDPVHNQPCKTYPLKLKKGTTYVIRMESTAFDAFLRLEDAQGKQVADDDDSGGGQDAQITFHADSDGEYKLFATHFDADSGYGAFTVSVRTVVYKTGQAVPLKDGKLAVEGQLSGKDAPDVLGQKHPHKVHSVRLVAGRNYTIDLESGDFDTFLRLVDSKFRQLAEDDDGGDGTNSRIAFTPPADGVYHIIATTFTGATGAYRLTVAQEK